MSGAPQIVIVGNLVADPELRFTPSGQAVVNFTVASTERYMDKATNEWKDGDSTFIRCTAWRMLAENVAETLAKGLRVIVTGKLKVRQYETKDGTKGTSVECDVDEVGPSLKNASARVTKVSRGAGSGSGDAWGGGQQRQQPASDPWSSSSGAGGWGNDEPPF